MQRILGAFAALLLLALGRPPALAGTPAVPDALYDASEAEKNHDQPASPGAAPFVTQGRWSSTASATSTGSWGDGVTLTWSVVPDGTIIPAFYSFQGEASSPSDLVSFLDQAIGAGAGGPDVRQHDWFSVVSSALNRWGALSGITFAYEPFDDGADLSNANSGVLGVRGDIRLSGHFIDGLNPDGEGNPQPNILGYSYFPSRGDFVLDTGNWAIFSYPENNYQMLRTTLAHEIGHGLGLNHVESDLDPATPGNQLGTFLMEPTLTSNFDGPQLDDILGIHRLYGDRFETGAGNDSPLTATPLGTLPADGSTHGVGFDAKSIHVDPTQIDFVSIDYLTDVDYFSFSTEQDTRLSVLLAPAGAQYTLVGLSGLQELVDPLTQGDLMLELFGADGVTLLATVNEAGLGASEVIAELFLPGPAQYVLKVSAATLAPQLYQMSVTLQHAPEPTAAALGVAALVALGITDRRRAAGR